MKLIGVYTPSHERLKDEWFLRTLPDDFEVLLRRCDVQGPGTYLGDDWTEAVLFKCAAIIEAIEGNWGEVLVYSDMDVTFFAPVRDAILRSLEGRDIVCQLDDPLGNLCTGFFGVRANAATLRLWQQVRSAVAIERRDQHAFNRLAREMTGLRAGYLPVSFFGTGTFAARILDGTGNFFVPPAPAMFHANFTVGTGNKVALLSRARRIVGSGAMGRAANNLLCGVQQGWKGPRAAAAVLREGGIACAHDR